MAIVVFIVLLFLSIILACCRMSGIAEECERKHEEDEEDILSRQLLDTLDNDEKLDNFMNELLEEERNEETDGQ